LFHNLPPLEKSVEMLWSYFRKDCRKIIILNLFLTRI